MGPIRKLSSQGPKHHLPRFSEVWSNRNYHGAIPHSAIDLKHANFIHFSNLPTDILKMLDDVNEKLEQHVQNIVRAYYK